MSMNQRDGVSHSALWFSYIVVRSMANLSDKDDKKKEKKKGQSMNHRGEELNYGGARRMSRQKIKRLIRETRRFITR